MCVIIEFCPRATGFLCMLDLGSSNGQENNQRNYSDISFWLELILEENDMEIRVTFCKEGSTIKHLPHGKRQIQEVLAEERSRKNV